MVKLSIVIITKNEEKNLPILLRSIQSQDYKDYEIIVSDAKSTDNTIKIAKEAKCKIVNGGMPSTGRNNGAKVAKGELILFLDSDVILPKKFLSSTIKEIYSRRLDIAGCYSIPNSKNFLDRINYTTYNTFLRIMQVIYPHMPGYCIFCKRSIHEKIKGFDPTIVLQEDIEYIQKAAKVGRFRMLKSKPIIASVRRLETEGRLVIMGKCIAMFFYRLFFGEQRNNIIKYEFDHYNKKKKPKQS